MFLYINNALRHLFKVASGVANFKIKNKYNKIKTLRIITQSDSEYRIGIYGPST